MSAFPPATLSYPELHEAIAATRPDEECLIFRDKRFTWQQITDRTRQLANYLAAQGLGCHTERTALQGWETGQDARLMEGPRCPLQRELSLRC
jgi:fatty-acyl-CoA synthase